MALTFSTQSGPRERRLQRKLNSPLFSATETLTQDMVQNAQAQDQDAMQRFMIEFRELVQRAVDLDKNVESDVILLLKAQLEQQYAICTGLPGDQTAIKQAIKKLIAVIGNTLRESAKNDPAALEKISSDDEHTQLHLQLCEHQIVSDILNPDEIIADDEQIPTLLNESEAGLQAALPLFPPERLKPMIEEAKALLKSIEEKGRSLPMAWQRLAQMEDWLQGG